MEENEFFSGVILIADFAESKILVLLLWLKLTVSGQSLLLWILCRAAKHRISLCNACAPQ